MGGAALLVTRHKRPLLFNRSSGRFRPPAKWRVDHVERSVLIRFAPPWPVTLHSAPLGARAHTGVSVACNKAAPTRPTHARKPSAHARFVIVARCCKCIWPRDVDDSLPFFFPSLSPFFPPPPRAAACLDLPRPVCSASICWPAIAACTWALTRCATRACTKTSTRKAFSACDLTRSPKLSCLRKRECERYRVYVCTRAAACVCVLQRVCACMSMYLYRGCSCAS
jgi:hypothetical protein